MILEPTSVNQILAMSPMDLVTYLDQNFIKPLPAPSSSREFVKHNHLLGEIANAYVFLNSLHAIAAILVRDAKRKKISKEEQDAAVSRRDVIEAYVKNLNMQYTAFSRMITVQKQADEELRMLKEE